MRGLVMIKVEALVWVDGGVFRKGKNSIENGLGDVNG